MTAAAALTAAERHEMHSAVTDRVLQRVLRSGTQHRATKGKRMSDVIDAEASEVEPETEPENDDTAVETDVSLPVPVAPERHHMTVGVELPIVPIESEFRAIASMAVALSAAESVPKPLRGKPNDVFLVLLSARDQGVALTTALREFHVIEGRVTLSPKVKLAMVRERGKREGWRIWPDAENDAASATWHATRADTPGAVFSATFTWEDAQNAQLVEWDCEPGAHSDNCKKQHRDKNRNARRCKDNWFSYPKRMLSWRAVGMLLDDAFGEVGTGLYAPDEIGAITDESGDPIDVASVEVPTGMSKPRASQQPTVEWATADDVKLARRIGKMLPADGIESVKFFISQRSIELVRDGRIAVTAADMRLVLGNARSLVSHHEVMHAFETVNADAEQPTCVICGMAEPFRLHAAPAEQPSAASDAPEPTESSAEPAESDTAAASDIVKTDAEQPVDEFEVGDAKKPIDTPEPYADEKPPTTGLRRAPAAPSAPPFPSGGPKPNEPLVCADCGSTRSALEEHDGRWTCKSAQTCRARRQVKQTAGS